MTALERRKIYIEALAEYTEDPYKQSRIGAELERVERLVSGLSTYDTEFAEDNDILENA